MGNKVKIMGMELDILSEDTLRNEFEEIGRAHV